MNSSTSLEKSSNYTSTGQQNSVLAMPRKEFVDGESESIEQQQNSGITERVLGQAEIDLIRAALEEVSFLINSPTQFPMVLAALNTSNLAFTSLASAEEFISIVDLTATLSKYTSQGFLTTLKPSLEGLVERFFISNRNTDASLTNEKVRKARADAISALEKAFFAQLEYEEALNLCQHKIISREQRTVVIMHRKKIALLMGALNKQNEEEAFNVITSLLVQETLRIRKCKELVASLNNLDSENEKHAPEGDDLNNNQPIDPLYYHAQVMSKESAKVIADMIVEPRPDDKELSDMELLTDTLNETRKAVDNPLSADYQRLRSSADELSGKPSKFKKVCGVTETIIAVGCGIVATLVLVGILASLAPSGGASILGIPLAAWLFGMASGVSLFAGVATLFSARRRGVSQAAVNLAEEIEIKRNVTAA